MKKILVVSMLAMLFLSVGYGEEVSLVRPETGFLSRMGLSSFYQIQTDNATRDTSDSLAGVSATLQLDDHVFGELEFIGSGINGQLVERNNLSIGYRNRLLEGSRANGYVFGGGGYNHLSDQIGLHAGLGMDYSLARHLNPFIDGRFQKDLDGSDGLFVGRIGLNVNW